MRRIRTLSDLADFELQGRRLLVRVDYNVPLNRDGSVADRTRIDATIDSLRTLRNAGARTILVSHLGRPDGHRDPKASLATVAEALSETLGIQVPLLEDAPGTPELARAVAALRPGEVALLENIRFQPGETKNDPALSAALADLADIFVGDAFGVAHRTQASNVGAARAVREKGGPAVAGSLMARELHFLDHALRTPERPFVAIMGGAKISGKIDVVRAILPRVDRLIVGGAMANTFLRALGLETGASLVEADRVAMARDLLDEAGDKLLLPVDVIVADEISPDAITRAADRGAVAAGAKIGDIGPRSLEIFEREIRGAATVLWNGPLGVFEMPPFSVGTLDMARKLAEAAVRGAMVVLGGGDSAAAAVAAGVEDRITHISTGGGASLDLLAGKDLPGVSALDTIEMEEGSLKREGAIGG